MNAAAAAAAGLEPWLRAYSAQPTSTLDWLRALKFAAWERLEKSGFPGPRDEAWRQTPLGELVKTRFARPNGVEPPLDRIRQLAFDGAFAGQEIVFINGRFAAELSTLHPASGVVIRRLSDAMADGRVAGRLGVVDAAERRTPFADLNTALFGEGVFVEIEDGAQVRTPVHVIHVSTAPAGSPSATHPRTLVIARRGAQATLVETYGGPGGEVYLTNAVTEIVLEDGAVLEHLRLQRESERAFHVATLAVRLERDARYASHAVTIGAALSRLGLDVLLDGEGGEAALNGLFIGDAGQVLDTHSRVEHARPHGSSRQLYKGILDGRSRGVFHGNVLVRPGAQKTDAGQTNKNLLLSREALVHSVPQLEIFADDVKCKHGSTTGQLDPAALFYLRSRGLGEEAARGLLTWAFASDVVGRLPVPAVKAALTAFLHQRLPSAPEEAVA